MNEVELRDQLFKRVEELWSPHEETYGPCPTVLFQLTGSTAGRAKSNRVNFNSDSVNFNLDIARKNLNNFLRITVPKELAHIMVMRSHENRVKPHGCEWYQACLLLGMEPYQIKATHNYEVGRTKIKNSEVSCTNCGYTSYVSYVKKHKMQLVEYRHNRCGGRVK